MDIKKRMKYKQYNFGEATHFFEEYKTVLYDKVASFMIIVIKQKAVLHVNYTSIKRKPIKVA